MTDPVATLSPARPLLTKAEAADRLRVSPRTLDRLISAGRIRVVHPSPGRTVIEERELNAYLAAIRRAA